MAESIMYADPVSDPKVLSVRYLPVEYMKQPRDFQLGKHPHRTWGERSTPLGSWRITPRTRSVVIVELPTFILAPLPHADDKEYRRSLGENWYPKNHQANVKADISGGLHELFHNHEKDARETS